MIISICIYLSTSKSSLSSHISIVNLLQMICPSNNSPNCTHNLPTILTTVFNFIQSLMTHTMILN